MFYLYVAYIEILTVFVVVALPGLITDTMEWWIIPRVWHVRSGKLKLVVDAFLWNYWNMSKLHQKFTSFNVKL